MELHIVFSYSAVGDVRAALAGRDASVLRFSDDLSCGPIDFLDPVMRRSWISDRLGYDNPDIADDERAFWPRLLEGGASRIVWISRRSSKEYCGFLEYLRRLDGRPTQMIDTTDARAPSGEFYLTTGHIPADQILSLGLLGAAQEIGKNFRAYCMASWDALRAENSELRVVDENHKLVSVPPSFYDAEILSLMTSDWQPMASVVRGMLKRKAVGDILLFNRLYALVEAGVLAEREAGRYPDVKRVKS